MKEAKPQAGSSRRNLITATMSAALAESVSSPRATIWPRTAPGSAPAMARPRESSASSVMSSPLDCANAPDLLLQQQHAVQQRLGGRRAARHINVDRHNAVATANYCVGIVVIAAAIGT